MNKLISLIASCDLSDVTSLRRVYENGNTYYLDDIKIICGESHRTTPEIVKFTIVLPIDKYLHEHKIPVADYGLRIFCKKIKEIELDKLHNTGKEKFTGKLIIHEPGSRVMLRNSAYITEEGMNLTMMIRFPVYMMEKRNVVNGKLSTKIIKKELTRAINRTIEDFNKEDCLEHTAVYLRQKEIRKILGERDLVAFIANRCLLPRQELTDLPMENAVPFMSPDEDEICLTLSDNTELRGMGIKKGITVITGGGYSGKSTLLTAMLSGIYDHIKGDGREYCITERSCFKIIAEDGRRVENLDITPFIRHGKGLNTKSFSTEHASGSTSQAANIMESLSFGCDLLLIDEDRTATNFMIRDARMKALIKNDPIIPFTDRVRQLYREAGVSTVLIIGGSSEYLDIADNIYFMEDYRLKNLTKEAEQHRVNDFDYFETRDLSPINWRQKRVILKNTMTAFTRNAESGKLKEHLHIDNKRIVLGDIQAELSRIESIVSVEQINAIVWILHYIAFNSMGKDIDIMEEISKIYGKIYNESFEFLISSAFSVDTFLELPHLQDIYAAVSRLTQVKYI